LGFVALLKFYELEGRFPAYAEEVPPVAVECPLVAMVVEEQLISSGFAAGATATPGRHDH
jgi:hypothetical protein